MHSATLLTGIEDIATRSDLLDRSLTITLPVISEGKRRTEKEFWAEFEKAKPKILGALYTVVAGALRELPNTKLERRPRMADFAEWITAAESSLGWQPETFVRSYRLNQESANDSVLDAPFPAKIVTLVQDNGGRWEGSASDLLGSLEAKMNDADKHAADWPRNARAASGMLTRYAPNLRKAGVDVRRERGRTSGVSSWFKPHDEG